MPLRTSVTAHVDSDQIVIQPCTCLICRLLPVGICWWHPGVWFLNSDQNPPFFFWMTYFRSTCCFISLYSSHFLPGTSPHHDWRFQSNREGVVFNPPSKNAPWYFTPVRLCYPVFIIGLQSRMTRSSTSSSLFSVSAERNRYFYIVWWLYTIAIHDMGGH